ncbi:MAG: single-stranded DNA-binding protein [Deltaproteobacteria bacterium]|jgi:single-strand DNA-binding protein|nr:single-stranded DNA-binding protein [Deltaproteobacteria bacterium]
MSVNKVILVGNLGRDPEVRATPSGQSVCNFSLATTERYTDRAGQQRDQTEWHNVVVWGKQADLCGQYLKKGRQVYVEGRLTTRQYEAKDGTGKRYRTEVVAQRVQFLGGRAAAGFDNDVPDFNSGPDTPPPVDDEDIPF